uniref:ceramide synthase 2-like isoform X1 n=1 Tax=Styela clava TaxID=7725 RepID=UPI00193ACD70|nr:ceramide synthase 2-like isoform X1 [Styela clava]
MEAFSNWFWQDYFWLPQGVSFRDLKDRPGFVYAKPRDLFYVPVVGLGIYFIRIIYERFIALPLAKRFGVSDGKERKPAQPNKQLEEYFNFKSKHPTEAEIDGLSKQLDWSTLVIKRWFRRKRNLSRPSLQTKFCEASWRCMFYTLVFTFGMGTLWQTPWFWDNLQCWVDYPRQSVEQSTYIYYMLEASFYVSLLFTVMQDVKRKDFKVQLIHHVATLFLIGFSYAANFVRAGTLVMAVHDISDIFLEGAKCFIYIKWNNFADTLFIFFALSFLISRLVIFPFWIIHTTYIKSMWLFDPYPGYYFFNALLMVLQVLHIFWSYLILRMAFFMVTAGKVRVEKDDRSDVEEVSTDEDTPNHEQNSINHDKKSTMLNDNHTATKNGPTTKAKHRK